MKKILHLASSIGIVLCAMACAQEAPREAVIENEVRIEKSSAKNLLSVVTLNDWLKEGELVKLIEVAKEKDYLPSHLPNALNVWRSDYENKTDYPYEGMRASRAQMATLLGDMGVEQGDSLVIYDDRGGCDAVRFAWILEGYGKSNVFILNGGKRAWQQAELTMNAILPSYTPSLFEFEQGINDSTLAMRADVLSAIQDTNALIVDCREPYEFRGQPFLKKGKKQHYKKGAYAYGCIPTALHYNWSNAVDLKNDHCIKSIEDLEHDLAKAQITPDKNIIVYCQSGVRSAHTTYVLKEILGYPNVKNYDGSWIEWSFYHTHDQSVSIEKHTSDNEHYILYDELVSVK